MGRNRTVTTDDSRRCSGCKKVKLLIEFSGNSYRCRPCMNDYAKEWYKKNHEENKSKAKWRARFNKYGIDEAEFEKMKNNVGGICPGCNRKENEFATWCVDHSHETGRIRGLLCNGCNAALGLLHDDANTLLRLVSYLDLHF